MGGTRYERTLGDLPLVCPSDARRSIERQRPFLGDATGLRWCDGRWVHRAQAEQVIVGARTETRPSAGAVAAQRASADQSGTRGGGHVATRPGWRRLVARWALALLIAGVAQAGWGASVAAAPQPPAPRDNAVIDLGGPCIQYTGAVATVCHLVTWLRIRQAGELVPGIAVDGGELLCRVRTSLTVLAVGPGYGRSHLLPACSSPGAAAVPVPLP